MVGTTRSLRPAGWRMGEAIRRAGGILAVAVIVSVVTAGCLGGSAAKVESTGHLPGPAGFVAEPGIHKIRHVIVIMQENRSFDEYFGTFPGADGIPMRERPPDRVHPRPGAARCERPFHDPSDVNAGGPHTDRESRSPTSTAERWTASCAKPSRRSACLHSTRPADPLCSRAAATPDVMGYHTERGDPELLGVRAATTSSKTTCSIRPRRGAFPPICTLVSAWSAACTDRRPDRVAPPRSGRLGAHGTTGIRRRRPTPTRYRGPTSPTCSHQRPRQSGATTSTTGTSPTAPPAPSELPPA